jgi:hypothetical protein
LLFDFHEHWKPYEASQFVEGGIVTRGRGIRQVGLHPLAAFASALDPKIKQLEAYSKDDGKQIWAGIHQKVMEHCQLWGGPLELNQQEVVNNTDQDEGAVQLQPPGLKSSFIKQVLDRGQECEEDVASEGAKEDTMASMQRTLRVKSASTKHEVCYLSMTMSRYSQIHYSGGNKHNSSSWSFHALHESIFAFLL